MIVDSYMARKTRSDIAGSVLTVQRPVAGQDLPMLRIGDGEYISTSQGTGEYAKRAPQDPRHFPMSARLRAVRVRQKVAFDPTNN